MAGQKKQRTPGGKKSGQKKKKLDLSNKSSQSPPDSQLPAGLGSDEWRLAEAIRLSMLDNPALQPAFPALTQVGIC